MMLSSLIPWRKPQDLAVWRDEGDPIAEFRREFDQLWNRLWSDWGRGLSPWGDGGRFGLAGNLEDQENAYVLRAEVPGFEPGEIDVKLTGNMLTVRAEHKQEESGGEGSSYRYGRFHETFTLPSGVIADQIDARYHSGVLELHLPKSEASKAKRIEVKAA